MIDTHAHIYDEQFKADCTEMLKRAFSIGVEQIWMPNCDSSTIAGMLDLEHEYPNQCIPMMGLHPCYVTENYESEIEIVGNWLSKRSFKMIGEIGLDFYWDLEFVKQQEEVFLKQLAFAKQFNIPVCIHSRNSKDGNLNAIQRCCDLIEDFGWNDLRGIFHCFSGNIEDAQRVIGLNFILGIGGVVTFKNGGIDKFLNEIDLKHLVLETDAPYLAPMPHRGKRNESSYLMLIIEKLANVKGISIQEVIDQTDLNAKRLISL